MKNLRYSSLTKRKKTFYRNLGTIRTDNKSLKTLELIAKKSYEALPAKLKRYVEDPEMRIKYIARMSKFNNNGVNFYQSFVQSINKNPNYMWLENKKKVWDAFKTERPDVYHAYLSYMRRRGISGTYYWFDNVEFSQVNKDTVTATLDLNLNTGYDVDRAVVFYDELYLEFGYSGGKGLVAAYLN